MFKDVERGVGFLIIAPWVLLASAPLIIVGIGFVTGPVKDAVVGLLKKNKYRVSGFRSQDFGVMGPARFRCAKTRQVVVRAAASYI